MADKATPFLGLLFSVQEMRGSSITGLLSICVARIRLVAYLAYEFCFAWLMVVALQSNSVRLDKMKEEAHEQAHRSL